MTDIWWTWKGGTSGNWSDGANWKTPGAYTGPYPNSGSGSVSIPTGTTITVSGTPGYAQTFHFTGDSSKPVTLVGGTFNLQPGSPGIFDSPHDKLVLNGTDFTLNGSNPGGGTIVLENGAQAHLPVLDPSDSLTVSFSTGGGTLTVPQWGSTEKLHVTDFGPGDKIVCPGWDNLQFVKSSDGNTWNLVKYTSWGHTTLVSNVTFKDGQDPDHVTYTYDKSSGAFGAGDNPVCYLRGTHILTPTGEVLVENLSIGDFVMTRFGGMRRISWIGRSRYALSAAEKSRDVAPVCVHAGALGDDLPARDLYISAGHSMLVGDQLLLARNLVNGVTITQDTTGAKSAPLIDYFQIDLGVHDCVVAEGAWSESFADGPALRDRFSNVAEFYAQNPNYRPPEELDLCAPRPEKGTRLSTALRPIVARAAARVVPGKLHGHIDLVKAPWTIQGWAWDEANPDLPVLLEVTLDGRVIGDVLACAYRKDLELAGYGAGRCAFFWTAPVTLPEDAKSRLRIVRASDGKAIHGSAKLESVDHVCLPPLRLIA